MIGSGCKRANEEDIPWKPIVAEQTMVAQRVIKEKRSNVHQVTSFPHKSKHLGLASPMFLWRLKTWMAAFSNSNVSRMHRAFHQQK
eukprot:597156-Amphidinium_carterae.1